MNKIGFLHRTHWRGLARAHFDSMSTLLVERAYTSPCEFTHRAIGAALDESGSALVAIGDYWLARLSVGARSVPAPLLKGRLEERVKQLTAQGIRLSAKERKRLKAEVEQDLLPQMPVNETSVYVALLPDCEACWIWGTQAGCDDAAGFLADIAITAGLTIESYNPISDEQLRRWVLNASTLPAELTLGSRMVVQDEDGHTLTLNGWSFDFGQKMRLLNQGGTLREVGVVYGDLLSAAIEPNSSHLRRITPTDALYEQWQENADPETPEIVRNVGGAVLLSAIERLLRCVDGEQLAMAEAV